ncbi:hypothetical protein C8R45DRAFT_1016053, partial [Mycena sanguinolenta]
MALFWSASAPYCRNTLFFPPATSTLSSSHVSPQAPVLSQCAQGCAIQVGCAQCSASSILRPLPPLRRQIHPQACKTSLSSCVVACSDWGVRMNWPGDFVFSVPSLPASRFHLDPACRLHLPTADHAHERYHRLQRLGASSGFASVTAGASTSTSGSSANGHVFDWSGAASRLGKAGSVGCLSAYGRGCSDWLKI